MVMIPVYERRATELPGASLTPKASDEAFGSGIGKAQVALGKSIADTLGSLGASLGAQQNEQDAITAKIETANHDARVAQFANEQTLTGDPATAASVPDRVREFATQDAQDTAQRIPQRYQGHFKASAQQGMLHHETKLKGWALKESFDYNGKRVDEAAGQQAGYLLQNPNDLPRAASAIRGVIDEMTVPEWKKNEFRERAGLQLMKPVIDGFLARKDPAGAEEALKRMQTEIPGLMGIKTLPPGQSPQALLSPVDRDNVIKTVWGEARGEGPEGQAAVAGVIRNRVLTGRWGTTGTEVVQAPGQFEAWQREDTRPKMDSLKPGSPEYDAIGKVVDGVFGGAVPDTTGGATHYYAPKAQEALGRQAPGWAKQNVKLASLGGHEFYAPEGAIKQQAAPVLSGKPVEIAASMIGAHEIEHRDTIAKFIGQVGGKNVDPATTAWCAAFVNAVLAKSGQPGTESLMARSFLNYGSATDAPKEGDIVVLSRGSDPTKGHVGFYAGKGENGTIKVLGGNQGDSVSVREFSASNVLGYRRIDAGDVQARPVQMAQATMSGAAGSESWVNFVRQSESRIKGAAGQIEAETNVIRQNTDLDLKSEAMAIRDRGEGGKLPSLSDEKLKALYPPERYKQIQQERQADLDYFASTSGWDAKPADVRARDLDKLNPANSLPGPDYAYRAENYSRALQRSAEIERKNEAAQKKNTDEAMKLAFDLHEKGELTPAVVETLRSRIPHGEYKTLLGMVRPEVGKDDALAVVDLEKNIERSPEEFSKLAERYLSQGKIKTETFRSFVKENRGTKKDDMPPSPVKSGRDFVRNSLDPGMFGQSSEMYLRAARERAMAEYDAWVEANPEAKRSEAIGTAEDIVKRHSMVATNEMSMAVGLSPYFVKPRSAITTQDVDEAEAKLAQDIQSGALTANQADIRIRQLESWRAITSAQERQRSSAPPAGGSRGRR